MWKWFMALVVHSPENWRGIRGGTGERGKQMGMGMGMAYGRRRKRGTRNSAVEFVH